MDTALLTWAGFAVCLALSFLFSGMEAGVFALSRLRIRQQMRAGRRSARSLFEYLENPENFLWTILVGNTVVNFLILSWVLFLLCDALRGHRIWFVVIFSAIVFLFYTFFDLLPKMLFRQYPNRLCMSVARPFRFIHLVFRPLVWLVERVSDVLLRWRGGKVFTGHLFGNREELRLIMQESAQGFTTEERAMINRVLDLQSLTVRQITRPLEQVVMVTMETPVGEALALCQKHGLLRLPVFELEQGRKRIVGIISSKRLLFQENMDAGKPVAEFVRPALYLGEDLRLEIALRRMQRSGQRLAIVLNRERREIGIVGLRDALKIIFGEMHL